MSGERAIGHLSQILLGEGRNFGVDGMVSFSHLQGWPVRHPAELPASPGPAGGWLLGGTTLVCPLHETTFDLRTGEAVAGSYPLRTYPARGRRCAHHAGTGRRMRINPFLTGGGG
jgi:nitrite reductase [NAD(P)H] small subunit